MIHSEDGYRVVVEQLGRLERSLNSLRDNISFRNGMSKELYLIMIEPYDDKIVELREKLREYKVWKDAADYCYGGILARESGSSSTTCTTTAGMRERLATVRKE